jgi:hypothetical protein
MAQLALAFQPYVIATRECCASHHHPRGYSELPILRAVRRLVPVSKLMWRCANNAISAD